MMMKPFDDFNARISCWYWRIIPYGDDSKISYSCCHMFRPYDINIFKIGMKSEYWFRNYWRGKNEID